MDSQIESGETTVEKKINILQSSCTLRLYQKKFLMQFNPNGNEEVM